mgnify:FL=1|jgi:hypothetical protein
MSELMNKHELKEIIQNGVVTVVFTKKDGTERTMKCTLLPEYLPQRGQLLVESSNRKENTDVLSVWDIDVGDWRSFRLDSVKEIR